MSKIQRGICECGCGGHTKVATSTDIRYDCVKGNFMRFISGHNLNRQPHRGQKHQRWNGGRSRQEGYIKIWTPDHPGADNKGYVMEHRLICERILGRILPASVVVHHINVIRDDNRPENLVVCQNNTYHLLLHRRERALKACGYANWRKCPFCKQYDNPANMVFSKNGSARHQKCQAEYSQKMRCGPAGIRDAHNRLIQVGA